MESTIKEFVCITKCGEKETTQVFKAIIKFSYDTPYRIKVLSHEYQQGKTKSRSETELFFDTREGMIESIKFHYKLCKENLFTDFIKIVK